ncbi:uncharacterized protein [Magallana gigas]|uniref:uncharacterized protein n=1 Tax=Magallana gigas TaxID=29159 RepID=UPI00333EFB45
MLFLSIWLFLGIFVDTSKGTITCYSCDGEPASACEKKFVTCPSGHMCFMESISSSRNETLFVAGCRTKKLCSWMTSPIGRRSIVHQCAECCDPTSSPNCNGRLCNFSGFCRVCYGVHQDASSCPLTQCADDEMCFTGNRHVGGGAFRRVYGCESSRMCLALAKAVAGLPGQPVGRRNVHGDTGLHTCDACCLTYDCNSRPCEQVVKDMPFMVNSTSVNMYTG